MKFKDYYRILDVAPTADDAAIKAAYRKLARRYHPDKSQEANAEERFKELNEAYETLKEPEKRRAYDQLKQSGLREGDEIDPNRFGGGAQGFDFGGGFDPGDLFESLFSGGRGRGPRGGARAAEERVQLSIDLERAYQGGPQRITLSRQGESRTLEVKIPAGVSPGQVIRLAGQGRTHGVKTDLLLEIRIAPHPEFRLEGSDIHSTLKLFPWQLALGTSATAATLAGEVQLAIPAGSNSGRKLRLKGRGYPKANEPAGDHYIALEIVNPELNSEADRAAFAALSEHFTKPL
jgi:curved DNA-binding protein